MPLKLGFIDWNGTLIDDFWLIYEATAEPFRTFGLEPPPPEVYREEIESNRPKFYQDYGMPAHRLEEARAIKRRVIMARWPETKLRDDAVETFRACRDLGLKLAIVSGEDPTILYQQLNRFGIRRFFDYVRGGAWPKERAFIEAITLFGLRPEEAFAVEDLGVAIEMAKLVDLTTFGLVNGHSTRARITAAEPNFVIETLSEIPPIVARINQGR